MSEAIKKILGDELYTQVTKLIKPDEFDIIKDKYVPLNRFNDKIKELKIEQGKIKGFEKQIKDTQKLLNDNEEYKTKYEKLNNDFNQEIETKNKEIENITKSTLISNVLKDNKAIYPDMLLDKIDLDKITVKDGKLENFTDTLTNLKKDYEKMFDSKIDNSTPPKNNNNGEGGEGEEFNPFQSLINNNIL